MTEKIAVRTPVPVMLMAQCLAAGGTERQLTEVARTLDRRRFTVHVGCFKTGFREKELQAAGVPVLNLGVSSFLRPSALAAAFRLRSYLRKNQIKLVHTFDYPLAVFGVPVARLSGVPIVLSSQRAHRHLTPPLYLKFVRFSEHLVDGIVVNCQAIQTEMQDQEHVPASGLRLCYNGIDTTRLNPRARARVPELTSVPLVIGTVSVLRPEKEISTLIAAFARILPEAPQTRLLIVGSGPELPSLQQLAETLQIQNACIFKAAVRDVEPWFKSIDIFVLSSRSEALSNSLMEAMACGCTCVASHTGGNPELISDGQTGLLFEPSNSVELAEKLLRLVGDPDLRSHLAARAAETIQTRFSLPASTACMQEIYDGYLAEHKL